MASHSKRPLAAAVGTAFLASVALAPLASAADNPFQLDRLAGGYSLAEKANAEGKCGEGKCGEGKCGGATSEAGVKAESEGKCGEGKCGGGH